MYRLFPGVAALAVVCAVHAENDEPVRIYLDVDRPGILASSVAIERGIRTALDEVGNQLAGRPVELVLKDHRGNTLRSKSNLEDYLVDEHALVVFAGQHSPPLVANLEFINQQEVLVLDPWASASPISRYASTTNWIFRLSVDDSKAGAFLAGHAVGGHGALRPALLLENTAWGVSNQKALQTALKAMGLKPASVRSFNWNLRPAGARILLREIKADGADAIILVANATEGKVFIRAMASLPAELRLPIISHWGITGGDFKQVVGPEFIEQVDLCFIQTRFSFVENCNDAHGKAVFDRAQKLFTEDIHSAGDIHAPVGFIHAYDLTRLLIAAIDQCRLSGDIHKDREAVRTALENLQTPVEGLIKRYERPFFPYSDAKPDAHEALGPEEYVMARYGKSNETYIIEVLK
jgi:branched-chain amino acid transport system substrate-binding protein